VSPGTPEHQVVARYTAATSSGHGDILNIFRLDRRTEGPRYSAHSGLGNRKLLWHGTNVAVVAAICKGGLRIMPHSSGRVGAGIYLASEQSKSAAYVQPDYSSGTGVMFLCEAALGRQSRTQGSSFPSDVVQPLVITR
jgi:poly [ADP-ribose] polymerase